MNSHLCFDTLNFYNHFVVNDHLFHISHASLAITPGSFFSQRMQRKYDTTLLHPFLPYIVAPLRRREKSLFPPRESSSAYNSMPRPLSHRHNAPVRNFFSNILRDCAHAIRIHRENDVWQPLPAKPLHRPADK